MLSTRGDRLEPLGKLLVAHADLAIVGGYGRRYTGAPERSWCVAF